jgi:acyl transferase domain-containing protein
MTSKTEIATVPTKENALAVFSAAQGLDPYLAQIRAEIDGFIPDITTKKGRDAIASIAHKVARSKTALDDVGKKLVADLKEVPKLIDAERKRMRDLLDTWKDEVRKPLDDWEDAEAARVAKLQNGIDWFKLRATENADLDSAELKATLEKVQGFIVGENWEEFEAEAHRAKAAAVESLAAQLAKREKFEADQAELAKHRAEAEAREQKDREERIAREAAEQATREAEEKAQRERDAEAKRVKDEQAAAERREQGLKLQAEKAEREKLEANQRAEQAERDSAARAEQAAQAERQRQADEKAEQDRQSALRLADTAHKSKVLKAAKEAFVGMNISEELAKAIVLKIARGEVPNVTINF